MQNVNIQIKYDAVAKKVRSSLAVFGSRLRNKQGESMFSRATLGDSELSVLRDMTVRGVLNICSEFGVLVSDHTEQTTMWSLTFQLPAWGGNTKSLEMGVVEYVAAWALYEYFCLSQPENAKEAYERAERSLKTLRGVAYRKRPLVGSKGFGTVNGEVS